MHGPGKEASSDTSIAESEAKLHLCRLKVVEAQPYDSKVHVITKWIREHIASPNMRLGRPGAVCPFVPFALIHNAIWLAEVHQEVGDVTEMCEFLASYFQSYKGLEPLSEELEIYKSLIVVFFRVNLDRCNEIMQLAHEQMKPVVVEQGFMLGEFYPQNLTPGVHNPNFYSLQSPFPLFVFRRMVPTDLMFLKKKTDAPSLRVRFIRAYLQKLGDFLSIERLCEAQNALREAEEEDGLSLTK